MKTLLLASLLALSAAPALAASQPKPDLQFGCTGDACGGVDVYNMGEIKVDGEKLFRVKFVVRGLGEGEESIITRYIGLVPEFIWADVKHGLTPASPVLPLETKDSFQFGGSISNLAASIVLTGEQAMLIEPGVKGTVTVTELMMIK